MGPEKFMTLFGPVTVSAASVVLVGTTACLLLRITNQWCRGGWECKCLRGLALSDYYQSSSPLAYTIFAARCTFIRRDYASGEMRLLRGRIHGEVDRSSLYYRCKKTFLRFLFLSRFLRCLTFFYFHNVFIDKKHYINNV